MHLLWRGLNLATPRETRGPVSLTHPRPEQVSQTRLASAPDHVFGRDVLGIALVALTYFLGAKAGLHLAFANKNVTAVWPPTGISVAALLLNARLWPGVTLGAWLSNLANGAGLETSTLVTVGNTLAPVAAWWLIRHVAHLRPSLERVRDVAGVLLLGGPVAMTVSATLGTASLALSHAGSWGAYGSTWLTWWVGDATGVVIVAPLILVAAARCWKSVSLRGWHAVEAVAVLGGIVGASVLTFTHRAPLIFLILPVAAWAAVRFLQLGAGVAVAIGAAVSITATVNGAGPFVPGLSTTGSLMVLQAFNGALALSTLMLAASSLQNARTQTALRADAADLEELLRQERLAALNDMTSVVSHDLRNPLNTIMNSHYLLRDSLGDTLTGEPAEFLDMAERASVRALELTEELLDYRRARSLELVEVDLRNLITDVIEATPPPPDVHVHVDADIDSVQADPSYLTRILTNLITNAYQAMPQGGNLRIAASSQDGSDVITLHDSGDGFAPDVARRPFDPFITTKAQGTGLGLAIVQRLVDAHHGSVSTENAPMGGALVTVRLPRGEASAR